MWNEMNEWMLVLIIVNEVNNKYECYKWKKTMQRINGSVNKCI